MRRLVINLDDELSNLLAKFPNQNEIVRQALRLYIGDITTDTLKGIRNSYRVFIKLLEKSIENQKETDSKIDYIARRIA
jgi:hypothetical protein